jgi:hypothetical protein
VLHCRSAHEIRKPLREFYQQLEARFQVRLKIGMDVPLGRFAAVLLPFAPLALIESMDASLCIWLLNSDFSAIPSTRAGFLVGSSRSEAGFDDRGWQ